jgi:Fe-S-cluster containining protein
MSQAKLIQRKNWYVDLLKRHPTEAKQIAGLCAIYTANKFHCSLAKIREAVYDSMPASKENLEIYESYWKHMDSYRPKSNN